MSSVIVAELETLTARMHRRGWLSRAAIIHEHGDVVSLCNQAIGGDGRDDASTMSSALAGATVHLAVVPLDGADWLYLDVGTLRWMALVKKGEAARSVASWLTVELRTLGVSVERDVVARE